VQNIASADLAATWAGKALVAKNSLTANDAKLVEEAFERRAVGAAIIRFSWTLERWAFRDCWPAGDRHPRTIRRWSGEGYRQEHAHGSYPAALSQPRAPSLCHATAVPRLRPQAIRSPSFALHAATRAGPQSERRIRGPPLPRAPSGTAPRTRRARVVEASRH